MAMQRKLFKKCRSGEYFLIVFADISNTDHCNECVIQYFSRKARKAVNRFKNKDILIAFPAFCIPTCI